MTANDRECVHRRNDQKTDNNNNYGSEYGHGYGSMISMLSGASQDNVGASTNIEQLEYNR